MKRKLQLSIIFILSVSLLVFFGCSSDTTDPIVDDDPPNTNDEDFTTVSIPILLGPPDSASLKTDSFEWNPWENPISPVVDGIQLEMQNLQWQVDKSDTASINGEWRVVNAADGDGNLYLMQVVSVSLPEFIIGHIGAHLGALLKDRPSGWMSFTLRNPAADAFEFELEVSWTGSVICLPIQVINDDGSRILDQVALMDPTGQRVVPITHEQERSVYQPCLSPDGKKVVFSSDRDTPGQGKEIYSVSVDGGDVNRLTFHTEGGDFLYPSFSPDLTNVIFLGLGGIAIVNLTSGDCDLNAPSDHWESEACYSPDGQWICFQGNVTDPAGVYIRRLDGSDRQCIYEGFTRHPSWSPDGTRIVFVGDQNEGGHPVELVLMAVDPDGSNLSILGGRYDYPNFGILYSCWSPDSSKILYCGIWTSGGCKWAILQINRDGSEPVQLSSWTNGSHCRVSCGPWSP